MILALADVSHFAIESVRLHEVTRTTREGRDAWLKRRRAGAGVLIAGGMGFLKASNGGIIMFSSAARWQACELASYRLLHSGEAFACGSAGSHSIWLQDLPGKSLRDHARDGTLTPTLVKAAGAELRRAHRLHCTITSRPWSHGDPHLANVLYDQQSGRARLLDFETQHELSRHALWRRADDLLTFLLELMSRQSTTTWPHLFGALFDGYGENRVVAELHRRLRTRRWNEFLLWLSRSFGSSAKHLRTSLPIAIRLLEQQRGFKATQP